MAFSAQLETFAVFVHPGTVPSQTSLPHSFFPCGETPLGCVPPFSALRIQQGGTALALGSERKQMTAFNTKGYGLELTIGFIKSAITSYGILETGELIFAALNSVVIGRLMPTKLCKSNFQECLPSIARDESRGKQIKISFG